MKTMMTICALVFSSMAMAGPQAVTCFNHSDADYSLVLVTNDNGMPVEAALNNADWGTAGVGAYQTLATQGENGDGVFTNFLVIGNTEPTLGLETGAKLEITYANGKINQAMLTPEHASEVGVQFDAYTCTP